MTIVPFKDIRPGDVFTVRYLFEGMASFRINCRMEEDRKVYLHPSPLLCENYPRARAWMFKYRAIQGWKPYIWMSKGKRRGNTFVFDRFQGKGQNKQYHKWGDGIPFFAMYVERLTEPGDVILDPFTGGGTVPAACKMLSRNYLAFEIEPPTATIARERLTQTPIPLPHITTTQLPLSL